jgi:hypothetical protein
LLAACAAPRPEPPARPDWPEYRAFVVPHPIVPIEANGSARFEYRGDAQTGSVFLQGGDGQQLLMRITSAIGTTALEARLTPERMLVMDFGSETYFLGDNTPDHRDRLFSLDLSPDEFWILLTGRVPRDWFEAHRGRVEGPFADMRLPDATYRFSLDEQGLPTTAEKQTAAGRVWRVEWREYQSVPVDSGSLRLPRKVRVYVDELAPRLVLGIAAFRLWNGASPPPLSFEPPEGMAYRGVERE